MNTSFYIWMGVIGVIAGLNLIMSKKTKGLKTTDYWNLI